MHIHHSQLLMCYCLAEEYVMALSEIGVVGHSEARIVR